LLALFSPATAIDETITDIKLGIMSDLHMNLNYNPDSSKHKCRMDSSDEAHQNQLSSIKKTFEEVKDFVMMKKTD